MQALSRNLSRSLLPRMRSRPLLQRPPPSKPFPLSASFHKTPSWEGKKGGERKSGAGKKALDDLLDELDSDSDEEDEEDRVAKTSQVESSPLAQFVREAQLHHKGGGKKKQKSEHGEHNPILVLDNDDERVCGKARPRGRART